MVRIDQDAKALKPQWGKKSGRNWLYRVNRKIMVSVMLLLALKRLLFSQQGYFLKVHKAACLKEHLFHAGDVRKRD